MLNCRYRKISIYLVINMTMFRVPLNLINYSHKYDYHNLFPIIISHNYDYISCSLNYSNKYDQLFLIS